MFGTQKKRIMRIDVKIPYDENNQLAAAYNLALQESYTDWVLFLDHDVFFCNPLWYEMCLETIRLLYEDPKAVCVGCMSGGDRHKGWMNKNGEPNDSIEHHIKQSKKYYQKYGNILKRSDEHIPGYFMLLKREIAKELGFTQHRDKNINNIDRDFGLRVLNAGYHIYIMQGLYIYHRRGMKLLKKEFKND